MEQQLSSEGGMVQLILIKSGRNMKMGLEIFKVRETILLSRLKAPLPYWKNHSQLLISKLLVLYYDCNICN